jgi:predicted transcriptional regulator
MKKDTKASDGKVPDNMGYLTSSSNRVAVLRSLVNSPGSPNEVRNRLGIPRSTFQRILSELQERNWAEKKDGTYSATPLGKYVEGYFSDCVETMSTLDRLEAFFEYVPFSEIDVGFGTLVGSEVTVPDTYSPHAPMEKVLNAVEDADEVRAVSHVITESDSKAFHEAVLDGTTVVNVIERSVAETILSRYDDRMEEVRGTDRTETHVYDGEFPFGLSIMDDTVFVTAYDDDGISRTTLENDTDEMLEWAERYHEKQKKEAEPIGSYIEPG